MDSLNPMLSYALLDLYNSKFSFFVSFHLYLYVFSVLRIADDSGRSPSTLWNRHFEWFCLFFGWSYCPLRLQQTVQCPTHICPQSYHEQLTSKPPPFQWNWASRPYLCRIFWQLQGLFLQRCHHHQCRKRYQVSPSTSFLIKSYCESFFLDSRQFCSQIESTSRGSLHFLKRICDRTAVVSLQNPGCHISDIYGSKNHTPVTVKLVIENTIFLPL